MEPMVVMYGAFTGFNEGQPAPTTVLTVNSYPEAAYPLTGEEANEEALAVVEVTRIWLERGLSAHTRELLSLMATRAGGANRRRPSEEEEEE